MNKELPPELAEQSRLSLYFPNDPDFLKAAWQTYVDCYRADKAKATEKKLKTVVVGNETALAFDAYWDAVAAARQAGHPAFARLDPLSGVPRIIGE